MNLCVLVEDIEPVLSVLSSGLLSLNVSFGSANRSL